MSSLAFDGARDFAGHKLCQMCWNSERPNRRLVGAHRCEGGKCECPCRVMLAMPAPPKPKRDLTLSGEISMENPITIS